MRRGKPSRSQRSIGVSELETDGKDVTGTFDYRKCCFASDYGVVPVTYRAFLNVTIAVFTLDLVLSALFLCRKATRD